MASPSTPPAGPATPPPPPPPELSRLGDIEALKLRVGPVRRNLFGPVDHQLLQQDFQRLLGANAEEAKKRWNFDFQRETPGEDSGIEWEELGHQDVPAFYRGRTVRPAQPTSKSRTSSSSGEGSPGYGSAYGSGDEYLEVTTRGCYRIQRHVKRKQSAITDYFKVKKRKLLHYKASSWL